MDGTMDSDNNGEYSFCNIVKKAVGNNSKKKTIDQSVLNSLENEKKDVLKKSTDQKKSAEQIKIFCEVYDGLKSMPEDNKNNFDTNFINFQNSKKDLADFVSKNADMINNNRKLLVNDLFISSLNNVRKMDVQLYRMLTSNELKQIQEANETIKSFSLFYEKRKDRMAIFSRIVNSTLLLEASSNLLCPSDFKTQFNVSDENDKMSIENIINKSLNGLAFLMNFEYLRKVAGVDDNFQDPFNIYEFFMDLWGRQIDNVINSRMSNNSLNNEFDIYLRVTFLLSLINPNNQFARKLNPNIISTAKKGSIDDLEQKLNNIFIAFEDKILRKFYNVDDGTFSGSFFDANEVNEFIQSIKDFDCTKYGKDFDTIIFNIYVNDYLSSLKVIDQKSGKLPNVNEDSSFIENALYLAKKLQKSDLQTVLHDVSTFLIFFSKKKAVNEWEFLKFSIDIYFSIFKDNKEMIKVDSPECQNFFCYVSSLLSNSIISQMNKGNTDLNFDKLFEGNLAKLAGHADFFNANILPIVVQLTVGSILETTISDRINLAQKANDNSKIIKNYGVFLDYSKDALKVESPRLQEMIDWTKNRLENIRKSLIIE